MILLSNAKIYTLDPANPVVDSLLIGGGRIKAAGERAALLQMAGPEFREIDLTGHFVLPGLTDAHIHLQHYALSLRKIDCETATLIECLARVADRTAATPEGNWVLGHGWQQNDWPDCQAGQAGFPNAAMLDAISTRHPIYLTAKSLHAGWANGTALAAAGVNRNTLDPPDGAVQRDAAGNPTGILFEGAMSLLGRTVGKPGEDELRKLIRAAQETLWAFGLTGVHDFDRRDCFIALQQLHAAGELKLRVVKHIPVEDLEFAAGLGLRGGFGDDRLRIGNVKAFADGALGPRTAAMLQPYENEPDNFGMLLLDSEQIFEYGRTAAANGLGMTIHAIGDRANHEVLNAFSNLREFEREHGLPAHRHRIEHVQVLHPHDVQRLAELDVIASMQPIHATSDMFAAEKYWGSRSRFSYAWRTLQNSGTRMAFGSDAPVESPNPFWGLHSAVTRTRPGGIPSPEGWRPEQKLNLSEALAGFTSGAAFAGGMEASLGMLARNFHADLIVLDRDPFDCRLDEIRNLLPTHTMFGGEWVYESAC